jgi:hypothetical protein
LVQLLGGPPRAVTAILAQVFDDEAHIFEMAYPGV